MPKIDFESIVPICGGESKVTCESTLPNDDEHPSECLPDFPPESFWLSEDAEFDWFDRNVFLDRMDSRKGNDSSTVYNPSSQRFSTNLVSKASIISLPMKPKSGNVEGASKRHSKTRKTYLPKPNELALKTLVEPASPMVSCIGRVRSRGRRRRTEHAATPDTRPAGKVRRTESRWIGLYHRFMKKLFHRRMIKSELDSAQPSMSRVGSMHNEPAGFRGPTRLASGMSVASWRHEDDFDDLTWHS